ncbi:MAG: SDR family oxidoreductase [Candidatus Methanomethylophilaceae archaeon]
MTQRLCASHRWQEGRVKDVTSGLGTYIAEALCAKGASVVLADRGLKGAKSVTGASVRMIDLTNPESIEKFSAWYISEYSALYILVDNASIMTPPYGKTTGSFESSVASTIWNISLSRIIFCLYCHRSPGPASHAVRAWRWRPRERSTSRTGWMEFKGAVLVRPHEREKSAYPASSGSFPRT